VKTSNLSSKLHAIEKIVGSGCVIQFLTPVSASSSIRGKTAKEHGLMK
jgi:hypothetical protein